MPTDDTFCPGDRVRIKAKWARRNGEQLEGTVVEYDGDLHRDDLVPVKWDKEPAVLLPERAVLERIDRTEATLNEAAKLPCLNCGEVSVTYDPGEGGTREDPPIPPFYGCEECGATYQRA